MAQRLHSVCQQLAEQVQSVRCSNNEEFVDSFSETIKAVEANIDQDDCSADIIRSQCDDVIHDAHQSLRLLACRQLHKRDMQIVDDLLTLVKARRWSKRSAKLIALARGFHSVDQIVYLLHSRNAMNSDHPCLDKKDIEWIRGLLSTQDDISVRVKRLIEVFDIEVTRWIEKREREHNVQNKHKPKLKRSETLEFQEEEEDKDKAVSEAVEVVVDVEDQPVSKITRSKNFTRPVKKHKRG